MILRDSVRSTLGMWAIATAGVAPFVAVTPAVAQSARHNFDIPAGDLGPALEEFARRAGITLSADPALTAGKRTAGLEGDYSVDEGFASLLFGTGLEKVAGAGGAYSLRTSSTEPKTLARVVVAEDVEVTGIRADVQETATKMALSVRETPQAISIITRESLDERQVMDLAGAIEMSAGAASGSKMFAGRDSRSGEQFWLRGQELYSGRDLRIDGFTSGGDRNHFDLAPFERVEVIKGPASMLYGQGSLGGFINMVSKQPSAETTVRTVVYAGSFDTFRTEVDATGALDSQQRLKGVATVAYENSGSFIDGVDSGRIVLAPTLEWEIGEKTRARASVIWQDDSFRPSMGIALLQRDDELVAPNVSRSLFMGVPNSEDSGADALHATVQVDQEIGDRWLASLVFHKSRNRLLGIADSYGYGLDEFGNTPLYSSFVYHDNDNWAGELRIDGAFDAFGREHKLLVGIEKNELDNAGHGGGAGDILGYANIYDGSLATAPSVPGHSHEPNYEARTVGSNEGAYAQLLLGLTDSTRLLLGARYDRTSTDDLFSSPVWGEFSDSQDSNAFTTRVGLTQDLGRSVTSYAVYAESFNPVYGVSVDGALDPETGNGIELGAKGEWLDGRLGASAAVYRQELDNRPIPDPGFPGGDFLISGGLQRTDGIELELTGEIVSGWTVEAAASWIDAEYVDPDDVDNFGKIPGGTIERQFALHTQYELQAGALQGLSFGATVLSVGDRIVLAGDNLVVPGYERLDLHVGYDGFSNLDLSLLIRNVTDERYIERPNSAYLYGHFFGSPRAVMLRAQYDF